jgi:hypothetical protein
MAALMESEEPAGRENAVRGHQAARAARQRAKNHRFSQLPQRMVAGEC